MSYEGWDRTASPTEKEALSVDTLTEARPAVWIELDEPNLRVACGETLDANVPDYFDPISRCYEEADAWSWTSASSWQ